jgi:hypothetical protein
VSYKLYTDKPNKFNCDIQIEGTSLAKSKVRLVLETNDISYMFYGRIENTGVCEVKIPKTKDFLSEGSIGNMKLEVIADDVFFEPWSSNFNVVSDKKINVNVKENYNKNNDVVYNKKNINSKNKIRNNEIDNILENFSKTQKKPILSKNQFFLTKKQILENLL